MAMSATQENPEQPSKSDWRQTITTFAGIISVLLVALGLFYTNSANRAQDNLTEQGQVTDSFGSAIDQLGSDQLDVRLGGIYALERLMHESPADEASILEVLSAYVRDHARPSAAAATSAVNAPDLPTDIQAALTVLGRRPDPSSHQGIDLSDISLTNADLTGANLTGADLKGTDLTDGLLTDANLTGTDLTAANLTGVSLSGASLYCAHLSGANLTGAHLTGTDLTCADLSQVNLTDAVVANADLTGVST
jgi:Pentapeptide repeats (8 copies)